MENSKRISLIPVILLLVVGHLVYFWVTPRVACRELIYRFCLVLTLIQCLSCGILKATLGTKFALGNILSGGAALVSILAAGALLLELEAPVELARRFLLWFSGLYLASGIFLAVRAVLDHRADRALHPPQRQLRSRLSAALRSFLPRQVGESYADRHVRNHMTPDPAPIQDPRPSQPPPLPPRRM